MSISGHCKTFNCEHYGLAYLADYCRPCHDKNRAKELAMNDRKPTTINKADYKQVGELPAFVRTTDDKTPQVYVENGILYATIPKGTAAPAKVDPVVEANRKMLHDRSQVGITKYGVTLGEARLTHRQILQHALEEALDLANYLQTEIMKIDAEAADHKDIK